MTDRIDALLQMLDKGHESALLRFSLGMELAESGNHAAAAEHLSRSVELDRNYSAAWKLLGKSLDEVGRPDEAADAFAQGIAVATENGDRQAAREMTVFLRRVRSRRSTDD